MMILGVLCFWLSMVTPSPGWSDPIQVTAEANNSRPELDLYMDDQQRFHLIWSGYGDENRIGYKAFLLDGTTVYPDTMISSDISNAMASSVVVGDSIFVFWRNYNPIYYCAVEMSTGNIVIPATYFFTTYTNYKYIRVSADSLGRIHAIYRDGTDVRYAVWAPTEGSGLTVIRDWKIEGAHAGGVLLVDGNRVHVVVQDPVYHDYSYIQYDLEGNTTIPLTDFTVGDLNCSRDPQLALDMLGNLMVLEDVGPDYTLWKLDRITGQLLVDQKVVVSDSTPEMYISVNFILRNIPGTDLFYLVWADSAIDRQILFLLMNSDGDVLIDWAIAYDYADEEPENLPDISGVVDSEGNLYIAYEQIHPVLGYFPTFGWFDYDYVSTLQQEAPVELTAGFSFSCNPVTGSVRVYTGSGSQTLRVFDISGREVSSISVSEGVGVWNGIGSSGERLPAGIYNIVGEDQFLQRVTLLER